MKKLTLLVALMVYTGTFKAYAQVVVYNFDVPSCTNTACVDNCHGLGNAAPSSINTSVIASASNFNFSSTLDGVGTHGCGTMNGFAAGCPSGNPSRARWARNWTTATSIDLAHYFSFTLNAVADGLVAVTMIRFERERSNSGPLTLELRSSLDGYTSTIWLQPISGTSCNSATPHSIVAGLPIFYNSVTFRLYAYSSQAAGGALRIDNVRIWASVTNLPIELLSFTGEKVDESKVRLLWSTASERDNEYFTVYRSLDMETWTEVGTVPGAGTSQSRIDYDLVDTSPHVGTNYYRLRQTDFDGVFVESNVIAVDVDVGKTFAVFPNPVAPGQPVQTSKKVDFIFDGLGKAVQFDPISITIEVPGVYTLVHIDENGFSSTNRVIVTH